MDKHNKFRFQFKHFGINDSECAMKIGTDGVLLGAWADVKLSHNILDIGSGSGLISLMLAQKSNANITGIEIDENAAKQSIDNINNSPWKNRITIINDDFTQWGNNIDKFVKFDHIVSNPPFFNNGPIAPSKNRATARHEKILGYDQLIKLSIQLLTDDGKLSIISPYNRKNDIIFYCELSQLYISRITNVYSKEDGKPVRILWEICKNKCPLTQSNISIRNNNNEYSIEYINLTKDFYLNF